MTTLSQIIAKNRQGKLCAIPSVCTAQPDVIIAALLQAQSLGQNVLIEATSNQVNQFGGYTGMEAADYISFVQELAKQNRVDLKHVHFGGDHLGPQVWRSQSAKTAMGHARDLVRSYVEAGFTKIHLDCSEGCAGEPAQVDDVTSAIRAADLASVCEKFAPDASKLSYVIGTEVPPPGGARAEEADDTIKPSDPDRVLHTIECHRKSFSDAGIIDAWPRIIGLVVQPGLEFAPTHIDRFDVTSENNLSIAIKNEPNMCFEAHSTDYQFDDVYPDLARRNFAVLKIGPALTFAFRQALYALDHIRARLRPEFSGMELSSVMEQIMLDTPSNWEKHYTGEENNLRLQRHFGYADRIRYYWPEQKAQECISKLFTDLACENAPRPLIEQYFPAPVITQANEIKSVADNWAKALVLAQIQVVLAPYFVGSK